MSQNSARLIMKRANMSIWCLSAMLFSFRQLGRLTTKCGRQPQVSKVVCFCGGRSTLVLYHSLVFSAHNYCSIFLRKLTWIAGKSPVLMGDTFFLMVVVSLSCQSSGVYSRIVEGCIFLNGLLLTQAWSSSH